MKRQQLSLMAATIALAILSSSSYAQNTSFAQSIYFGAGVAQTDIDINQQNIKAINALPAQSAFDNQGGGYSVFLGTKLDRYLSLEMAYTSLGDIQMTLNEQTTELFSIDALNVTGILSYPLSQNTDVFAKLGVAEWKLENENSFFNESGTGLTYGLGFDINLYDSKSRALRVEWTHQEFDEISINNSDTITASMVFNFD